MARILNFEDFATKREVEKLIDYATRELSEPRELATAARHRRPRRN